MTEMGAKQPRATAVRSEAGHVQVPHRHPTGVQRLGLASTQAGSSICDSESLRAMLESYCS
jgi:hypothetical protein